LGGGGTEKQFCRDKRCITEQDNGIIQSNLIASCSDDGIYINRSAASKVLHNSLIDTGGISVRFAESSADVHGNLVDGAIRNRDGGVLRAGDNYETGMVRLYLGLHPVRDLYVSAGTLNFMWYDSPPRIQSTGGPAPLDLCGTPRPPHQVYGAFEDFFLCLSGRRF
jgi:parallel beta-helix repeat protein